MPKTYKKISFKNKAKKTSIQSFIDEIGRMKKVVIENVIYSNTKIKASITHIGGYQFLSIRGEDRLYPHIGFNLSARAILENNLLESIEVLEGVDGLEDALDKALESDLGLAFEQQTVKIAKRKANDKQ